MTEPQYVRITEKGADPSAALSQRYTDDLLRQTLLVADLPWMLGPFNPETAQEVLDGFTRTGGKGSVVEGAPSSPRKAAKRPAGKRVTGAKAKKTGSAKAAKKTAGAKVKKAGGIKAKKAGSARKAGGAKAKKAASAKAKKAPSRGKAKSAAKRKR